MPQAKMATSVPLVPQDPLDLLESEESKVLLEDPGSRVCPDPKVLLERPASPESRVCLERLEPLVPLVLEATEVSLVSVVLAVQWAQLVLAVPPVLLVTMALREMEVLQGLKEPRAPQGCRVCLEREVLLACPVSRETEVTKEVREPTVCPVRTACAA